MPKGLPQTVKDHLEKCRSAAIAAVEAYNRPGPRFRTAQYLVLIVIAWTALLHAVFYRRGRRPWVRQRKTGRRVRYVKIHGDYKHWDLEECLKQHLGGKQSPERKNLEFLLGLRHKIEHRHLPELDVTLYGECQAALMNLEELIVREFGPKWALADQLAVSLQFSRLIPDEKSRAAKLLATKSAKAVIDYVERFRGKLTTSVINSIRYSFSVYLVPKVANRAALADAAVQFVKVDEASPQELARLEKLNVLIKEKQIPIANLGLYKPSEVVEEVKKRLPFSMDLHAHTRAWKHYKIRPPRGDAHPELTRSEHCVYDETHKDYVYTKAWVEKLARELADPKTYQTVVGRLAKTGSSR
jgi:hypothetical protein